MSDIVCKFKKIVSKYGRSVYKYGFGLGADFKNKQTTKQLNKFIQTNRKVETKLYLLPIGPFKVV